jgi:hypothetical protein
MELHLPNIPLHYHNPLDPNGYFNAIMKSTDRSGGDIVWYSHLDNFSACNQNVELLQPPYTRLKYTWHNGQHNDNTIKKSLTRFLATKPFLKMASNSLCIPAKKPLGS